MKGFGLWLYHVLRVVWVWELWADKHIVMNDQLPDGT